MKLSRSENHLLGILQNLLDKQSRIEKLAKLREKGQKGFSD